VCGVYNRLSLTLGAKSEPLKSPWFPGGLISQKTATQAAATEMGNNPL